MLIKHRSRLFNVTTCRSRNKRSWILLRSKQINLKPGYSNKSNVIHNLATWAEGIAIEIAKQSALGHRVRTHHWAIVAIRLIYLSMRNIIGIKTGLASLILTLDLRWIWAERCLGEWVAADSSYTVARSLKIRGDETSEAPSPNYSDITLLG